MKLENKVAFIIREFELQDYDAVIALWDDAQLPYKPNGRDRRDRIKREFQHGNMIFLLAVLNDRIVGSILGTHDGRKGWINRLAVASAYQQRGIARQLISAVENLLDEKGIDIIACFIEDWNTSSMEVFEHLGFRKFVGVSYFTKRKYPEV